MMRQIVTISPEYLSFYVAGSRDVDIPLDHDRRGIVANAQCINIPCRYWFEGETILELGSWEEVGQETRPAIDVLVDTPARSIIVFDANTPEILSMAVPTQRTRVRVWINDATEPDEVVVALG